MEFVYRTFGKDEDIPVLPVLHRRKLFKYYNRETMASVLLAHEFLKDRSLPSDIPFYYASSELENLDVTRNILSRLPGDVLDVPQILSSVSTIEAFKMMRNMPTCFIAIENGLVGDNNVIVDSASALLCCAVTAPTDGPVLLGAGRLMGDGSVECGFASGLPCEWEGHPLIGSENSSIEIFRMGQWR